MNTRFASLAAAVALSVGATASPVIAQTYQTFGAWQHEFTRPEPQSRSFFGVPSWVLEEHAPAVDAMTTGSLDTRRASRPTAGPAYRYSGSHAGGPANGLPRN